MTDERTPTPSRRPTTSGGGADPGGVPGAAQGRHRAAVHRGVHRRQARGRLLPAGPAAPSCSAATPSSSRHCGWPSFYSPLAEARVEYIEDTTLGMKRVEVRCAAAARTSVTSSRVRGTTSRPTGATASTRSACASPPRAAEPHPATPYDARKAPSASRREPCGFRLHVVLFRAIRARRRPRGPTLGQGPPAVPGAAGARHPPGERVARALASPPAPLEG